MQKIRGVTLIEVMITVVIVGILSAIAIPSYTSYVIDSRRSEATSALLELGQYMERHYTANGSYQVGGATMSVADLPFASVPKDGGTAYYNVAVVSSSATYTLTLTPTGVMAGDSCGNYTLNQTGVHTPAADSACW